MSMRNRQMHTALKALCPLAALSVSMSMILVGIDTLNHLQPTRAHVSALAVSVLASVAFGAAAKGFSPWFGGLAYGVMMGAATLGLPLAAVSVLKHEFLSQPSTLLVVGASLVLFSASFPAVMYARSKVRGSGGAI